MATKIPVVETVFNTYGMVAQHGAKAFQGLLGPFLLVIAVLVFNYFVIGPTAPSTEMDPGAAGGQLLLVILLIIPYVMIYVGLFRLGLTGDSSASGPLGFAWSPRHTRVLGRSLLLAIILIVLAIPIVVVVALVIGGIFFGNLSAGETPSVISVLLSGIIMFALAWPPLAFVAMRLSLYPASAAVDENITLGGSWTQTAGNGIPLMLISILVALPIYVISIVAGLLFGGSILYLIVSVVITILAIMLTPFMISIVYKALANRTAAAPR